MKRKKILCNVSNAVLPLNIKEHKQNYETYQGLLNYFDEVHIICRADFSKTIKEESIFIHHIKVPKSGVLRYLHSIVKMFFKVLEINKNYNISVLTASEPTTGGVVCSFAKKMIKKPFLLEVQGETLSLSPKHWGFIKSRGMKILTLFSAGNATHIRVVSNIIQANLIQEEYKKDAISIIYPRLKLDDFNIDNYNNTKEGIYQKYNIDKDKKIFLFLGRLVVSKGVKYLLEAISKIKNENIMFLIAGDGELKNELELQAKKLNILNNVKFIGAVNYEDVPYLMSGADYFIVPSVDEGFGRVVIEAMAMRSPVLASRVGGIKDIIEDGENGFFFESENSDAIVKSINKVLNMADDELNVIKDKAYKKVYENYEYEMGMKKYIDVYRNILNDN